MQQINQGLRGRVGVSDVERLEYIKSSFYGWEYCVENELQPTITQEEINILSDVFTRYEEQAEKISEMEKYMLDTSGKMDALHEYLRENHYKKGWGKHVIDVAIQVMKEQQKEIERLNKEVEKEMHTGYSLEGQYHEVKEKLEKENARLREALEFYGRKHNYAYSALEDNIPIVNLDGGEKARQALKE